MALFVRVCKRIRSLVRGLQAPISRVALPATALRGEEEMFEMVFIKEAEEATREYLDMLIDLQNKNHAAAAAKKHTTILEEGWLIISSNGHTVENLQQKETTEFLNFLDRQFDNSDESFVF